MQILGSIGIDPILVVVQTVNFLILVFVLNKFLYKPVSTEIEKDETELANAKNEIQKLETQKEQLNKENAMLIVSSQNRSEKILGDAKTLADKIKSDAITDADKKALAIVYHVKTQMEQKESELRREMREEEKQKITRS